jgi:anti-sigma factor (TIGR02949 family)
VRKLSCQEVLDQLWEYLDEDARAELCAEIQTHLTACSNCQVEVDTIKHTILLYRSEEQVRTPVQLSDRLRAALADAYDHPEEGETKA